MTAATDLALFILKPPRFSLHRFVIYLQFDFVATVFWRLDIIGIISTSYVTLLGLAPLIPLRT